MKRILTAAVLLILAAQAQAAGLRTPLGEVVIKNLKIGQTYSMYKLLNLPLRLINTGDEQVTIRVEPVSISSEQARSGYEPVPNLDWVRVEQSTLTVAPNREGVTDLIITVPNDPALLGRRFQEDVWSHTIGGGGAIAVGLQSHVLMYIDSTPSSEEELKKKYVDERVANLDFTILPPSAQVLEIPLGRAVSLRKERKLTIKLINPNDQTINFRVRSIPVWESLITPPQGFEPGENPQWLKPERDVVKVEGNSIGETSLTLSLPADRKLGGRHLFFLVSFEVLEQKIPTRFYYHLMVDTEKAPTAPSAK